MILQQIIPLVITFYWSILVDFFNDYLLEIALTHASNHLLVKLNKLLDFAPLENMAVQYHHSAGPGSPVTHPTEKLARAILVKCIYDLSLRELEERLHSDMIARWFVGYTLFDVLPDHSTLERFEQWVSKHHRRMYHDTILKQIDEAFPQSRKLNQIGDTYAMIANAAEEELITRLRHTAECLLREAAENMSTPLSPTVACFPWHKLFGVPKEKNGCFLDKKQRQLRIQDVVLAAHDLHQRFTTTLQAYPNTDYPGVRLWAGYLGKIIHDEVNILDKADADGNTVVFRTTKERRKDPETSLRIGSATDPEATYRVHGDTDEDVKFGYNIQVCASTDGFIRETQAFTGAVPDQAGIASLIAAQVEHLGTCPPKLIYDQAAGTGKARADVAEVSNGQTQLVSNLLPYDKNSGRFGPYDFSLSEDGETLTCPAGKQSSTAYPSGPGDGRVFRFFACQCWLNAEPPTHMKDADLTQRCPLWKLCRDHRQGPGRTRQVFVSDYRGYVLASKEYNQTDIFQVEMKQRPQIERVIFELTHYNGARPLRVSPAVD